MKLSVTQPYFLPYLGFFQLINASDKMIIFDTVKYQKRSWMNRNRILHPNKDFNYITVPVKKNSGKTFIHDIEIVNDKVWQQKILGQITVYAKKAPYYKMTRKLLVNMFSDIETQKYSYVSIKYIEYICNYLDLEFHYEYLSKLNLALPEIKEKDEWSLYISKALNANEYINLPNGAPIFDEKKFYDNKIKLSFIDPHLREYSQITGSFKSHLSIIDILMWNSKQSVREMIKNDYNIVCKKNLIKEINV